MAKEIYTEIFEYYCVNHSDDHKKRAMRKVIKTRLATEYPGRSWEELSELEQRSFKLVTMKEYMIDKTPEHKKKKVTQIIDDELKNTLLEANEEINKHNQYVDVLFRQFYNENASEEENHASYEEYCGYFPEYAPGDTIPTYDEWKRHPYRFWDILNSNRDDALESMREQEDPYSSPVTQDEIDHYTLMCLVAVMKKKFNIFIDTDDIKHCLEATSDIYLFESEPIQIEIDKSSKIPEDEQKKIIQGNLEMMNAWQKLQKLDFISYSKKNTI